MRFPNTELLFDPLKLAALIFWFYLCVYLVRRMDASDLISRKYKPFSNILLFITGPLFVFVLIVVDAVRKADEQDASIFQTLKIALGKTVMPAKKSNIGGARGQESLVLLDPSGKSLSEVFGRAKQAHGGRETLELTENLIGDAVGLLASDILIDPASSSTSSVRFRVDGVLRTVGQLDMETSIAVVNSFKAISGMDISEKRRPQDGAFIAKTTEGSISFRVASAGVLHGEKLSIRVLNQISAPLTLKAIGLSKKHLKMVADAIGRQNGMILLCGPTGSGKSTTLYSMLRTIDFESRNVITIEDPVEYVLPQASQIEINEKANITFAVTLRSVLRQDPDVISIGEIRDEETAEIALRASQTGHLVFATLHSSSNMSSLVRLLDLGIKPLLIASALNLIISQRLVRKLCDNCKVHAKLDDTQIINLKKRNINPDMIMEPKGCSQCGGTGYKGRTGFFDIMIMEDNIKSQLVDSQLSMSDFNKYGEEQCRKTMQKQGMKLVVAGQTSLTEVKRVVSNL